jgi:PIN domain nuclease of toxin-antitoxin system
MRILLDTHTFLWWITDDQRMSSRARELMADGRSDLFFSVASGWEIAIKAGLGRIKLPSPLGRFLVGQLRENRIEVLAIEMAHALHVHTLLQRHRDPFDRMLVAQAQLEKLSILTADRHIAKYEADVVW